MGVEPTGSLQAVVFAALFSGVVSMSDNAVLMAFGTSKKDLVDNFQMGTETALGRANVIRTTKVETLQALVMYMVGLRFQYWRTVSLCIPIFLPYTSFSISPPRTSVALSFADCLVTGFRDRGKTFSFNLPMCVYCISVLIRLDRYLCAVARSLVAIALL